MSIFKKIIIYFWKRKKPVPPPQKKVLVQFYRVQCLFIKLIKQFCLLHARYNYVNKQVLFKPVKLMSHTGIYMYWVSFLLYNLIVKKIT